MTNNESNRQSFIFVWLLTVLGMYLIPSDEFSKEIGYRRQLIEATLTLALSLWLLYRSNKNLKKEYEQMRKEIIIRKTIAYYYQQYVSPVTEEAFKLWVESLEEPIKSNFKSKGLYNCMEDLNFRRFSFELRDKEMEACLKRNLTEEDFNYWKVYKREFSINITLQR